MEGTTVLFNGIAAPLFYVSPTQINAQVPVELVGVRTASVQIRVAVGGEVQSSISRDAGLRDQAPGIFTLEQDGRGNGVVTKNENGSLICPQGQRSCTYNPAIAGEVVVIYATGLGPVIGTWSTGVAASQASPTVVLPTVTLGLQPARVLYAGLAPGYVGLYQINIQMPNSIGASGSTTLSVSINLPGSISSITHSVNLAVRAQSVEGAGPAGGSVTLLAVDPKNPEWLYAGVANAGIFGSRDGGETWIPRNEGLPFETIRRIQVHPADSSILYAINSSLIFKSTNYGASWFPLRVNPPGFISDMLIDPDKPSVVHVLTTQGIYRSLDGGETWTRTADLSARVLSFDPTNSQIIYAAGLSLYKSVNGGGSWEEIADVALQLSMIISPTNPNTLYISNLLGLYKSVNGGRDWSLLREANQDPLRDLLILPSLPETVFAVGDSFYRSDDGGHTWNKSTSLRAGMRLLRDPLNAIGLLAGTRSGFYKSVDLGKTWQRENRGLTGTAFSAFASSAAGPPFLYGTDYTTFYRSSDRGENWARVDLPEQQFGMSALAVHPDRPNILISGSPSGIHRSTDGGSSWSKVSTVSSESLVFHPTDHDTIYSGSLSRPYKSTDGGLTWNPMISTSSFLPSSFLVVSPSNPDILYAGTGRFSGFGVNRSSDGGTTWRFTSTTGIPRNISNSLTALAIDPQDPNTVYIGVSPWGLFKTTDAGSTWRALSGYGGGASTTSIVIDPNEPSRVYTSAEGRGMQLSTDAGRTWAPFSAGLENTSALILRIDPANSSILYVSTNRGIFRSIDKGQSWQPMPADY